MCQSHAVLDERVATAHPRAPQLLSHRNLPPLRHSNCMLHYRGLLRYGHEPGVGQTLATYDGRRVFCYTSADGVVWIRVVGWCYRCGDRDYGWTSGAWARSNWVLGVYER